GLKPPRLDFLEVDVVAALAEESIEEERDFRLLGLEARDADERAGEVDQVPRVDLVQHGFDRIAHGPNASMNSRARRLTGTALQARPIRARTARHAPRRRPGQGERSPAARPR